MIAGRPLMDDNEPVWLLTGEQAALLAPWAPLVEGKFRREGLVMPPDLDALFFLLRRAAEAHVAWQQTRDAGTTNLLPSLPAVDTYSAPSSWLSTRAVADAVGVSPRAVSDACAKGLLNAVRAGEGRGVAWAIDPVSVAEWKTARDARGRRAA